MTGSARPRHIRDIAHLYLSRRKVPAAAAEEGPGPLHLCITSSGRNCMSGFHTANLAAALAERQSDVRIFDLSGAQPNASFYFSHPPALYLDYTGDGRQRFIPALPRVSIAFDLDARPRRVNSPGAPPVTIYHLPPDDMESMREVWRSLEDRVGGRGWRVHLTDQPLVDEALQVERYVGVAQRLDDWSARLGGSLRGGVERRLRRLAQTETRLANPAQRISFAGQRLGQVSAHLLRGGGTSLARRRGKLMQTERLLEGFSYQRVLDRGFALVEGIDGGAITRAAKLKTGDDITLHMADGEAGARITGKGHTRKNIKTKTKPAKEDARQGKLL